MTETASPGVPLGWITKRDGRLVPFEADKISRALFRATEGLGRPDAFLAHELTDGVLHFLVAEVGSGMPTTAQIADLVAKVVRELGQPALAQAFVNFARPHAAPKPPVVGADIGVPWAEMARWVETARTRNSLRRRLADEALRTYSLHSVYTPDLVAAHREGLLLLGNLDTPLELAAAVLVPGTGTLAEQVVQASEFVGGLLAINGPEHALTQVAEAVPYDRDLRLGLEMTGLNAVVNLNGAAPPGWAEELAEGPLFGDRQVSEHAEKRSALCDNLLDLLLLPRAGASIELRVDWHLAERDFLPEGAARLQRLARRALDGATLAFVFDRPRRRPALAEGLDRHHAATLLTVGLHLPRLAEQRQVRDDPAQFLQKLGSLVRMALSAGCQKRDCLRRQAAARPGLAQGFRLDRARLVLVPVGLDRMARQLAKCGLAQGNAGAEFGRNVVHRIREVVRQDRKSRHLDACIDGPAWGPAGSSLEDVAGLTAWDADALPRQQLRAAGLLHAAAEMGTAAVLTAEGPPKVEEAVALLRHAWRKTEITRLRFVRGGTPEHQLTASWAE